MTLDETQQGIALREVRETFPAGASAARDDWKAAVEALVERAWRGVRGQGG